MLLNVFVEGLNGFLVESSADTPFSRVCLPAH